jgi:sulfate permease, SulP family
LQDHLPQRTLVLDLKNVIYVDSSGADSLCDLARACAKNRVRLVVCGLLHQPLDIAQRCGFTDQVGADQIYPDLARAVLAATEAAQSDPRSGAPGAAVSP